MMLGDESLLHEFPARTNILVVGSSVITLLDMKKTMQKFAYQVTIFHEAYEAIAFLTNCTHEINLVIWDFHMPEISGLEALKIIGSKMDLPVVIMSSDNETESVMKATMHGACDYIMKPVREQVISTIWQHIVRKKMMSKPVVTHPVQSVMAQSHGLDQANNDPKSIGQDNGEQIIDMEEKARMIWNNLDLSFQSDLDQTNSLYLDNDDLKIIYQDNGERKNFDKDNLNEATKPRMMCADVIQSVQSNPVPTSGLELDHVQQSINKKEGKKPRKPRMTWTTDLHQRFLEAIEIVGGIEKANPMSVLKYLQEMNIKGLTRTNVASHLQKHRIHLEENKLPQQTLGIGHSTAYRPLSLLAPSNVHTAYRPSSLLGPSNTAHTEIGRSTAYGPSSLLGLNNAHTEIGQSMAYRSSSLLGPGNAYTPSQSMMNGRDMNQIHQHHYPNGYLKTNNNQFMTNPLPCLPYVDNHHDLQQQQLPQQQPQQQQHHQQQYQFPQQTNYGMNMKEPEQVYGTVNELIYPELPYDPNEYFLQGNNIYQ